MLYFICEENLDILMVRNSPQMSKSQASYANLIHTEISLDISLAMHWLILPGFLLLGVLVYKKSLRPITFLKKKTSVANDFFFIFSRLGTFRR